MQDQIRKETSGTKAALLESDYNQPKLELSKRFSSASSILMFRERQILAEIKQYVSVLAGGKYYSGTKVSRRAMAWTGALLPAISSLKAA